MARQGDPDNTTNVVLIVVGSVMAVILVLVLVCGGIFFLTTYVFVKSAEKIVDKAAEGMERAGQSAEAQQAADRFIVLLSAGQTERAYDDTTNAYQGRKTLDQFRAYVDAHPVLKKPGNVPQPMGPLPLAENNRVQLRVVLNGNQATSLTCNMLREDGRWKVDEFTVP
jgi:hypothetical protein